MEPKSPLPVLQLARWKNKLSGRKNWVWLGFHAKVAPDNNSRQSGQLPMNTKGQRNSAAVLAERVKNALTIGREIMPMVTVSISPELATKMREAVDSGAYASGSEVVRDALRLWLASEEQSRARTKQRHNGLREERLNVAELYAAHSDRIRHG